jgi:hypothetical protein
MKRYFSLALLAALAAFLAFLAACGDAEIEPWDFNDYMLATEGQGEALDDFIKNWIEECSGEDPPDPDKCGSINGGGGNSSASTGGDGDDSSSVSTGGDGDDNSSASVGGGDDNSSSSKNNSSSSTGSGSGNSSSSKNSSSSTGGGSSSSATTTPPVDPPPTGETINISITTGVTKLPKGTISATCTGGWNLICWTTDNTEKTIKANGTDFLVKQQRGWSQTGGCSETGTATISIINSNDADKIECSSVL